MAYPSHPPYAASPFAGTPPSVVPARPATLTAGFVGALAAGLFSIVGALLLILNARELAEQTAADAVSDAGLAGSVLADAVIDEAAGTLVVRGVLGLVSGVLVLAFALAARNAALWARIVLTVVLLGGLCTNGLVVSDVAPAASKALEVAAIGLSLVVVVLLFLPPTNRYAAARRQRA